MNEAEHIEAVRQSYVFGFWVMGGVVLVGSFVFGTVVCHMAGRIKRLESAPGVAELLGLRSIGRNGKHKP